jgi:hypothetical protein
MIEDTIRTIETRIGAAETVSDDRKRELLELLATLRSEVENLARTNTEQAQSIASFAEVSTHEATREDQNPKLRELSLQGLSSSVDGFEQSHPALVRVVNNISQTLANLGI